MVKRAEVKVLSETLTGLNDRLSVNGVSMTNNQAYSEAKKGNIQGFVAVKNEDGTKFIRSKPDSNKNNNLEKK